MAGTLLGHAKWTTKRVTGTNASVYHIQTGTVDVVTTNKRAVNTYCLRCNPTTTALGWARLAGVANTGIVAATALDTAYFDFWFRPSTLPASTWEYFAAIGNTTATPASTTFAALSITSGGIVEFHDFDTAGSGTIKAAAIKTGTVPLTDQWYYVRFTITQSTGTYSAKFYTEAGVLTETISGTGADLNTAGGLAAGYFCGKFVDSNSKSVVFYFADAYCSSGDFQTITTVTYVRNANGDGSQTGFVEGAGGAANKWQEVDDDEFDGLTSYLKSTTTDTYTATSQPGVVAGIPNAAIIAIVPTVMIWDSSGADDGIQPAYVNGGTTTLLTESFPGATVNFHVRGPLLTSNGGQPWTRADADAIEAGVKHSTAAGELRLGWVGVFEIVDIGRINDAGGPTKHPPRRSTRIRIINDRNHTNFGGSVGVMR